MTPDLKAFDQTRGSNSNRFIKHCVTLFNKNKTLWNMEQVNFEY